MKKIKLLIVDDEVELATTLAERLQFRGLDADAVINCTDAIKQIELKKYDVALIDVKLKRLNGIELMKLLKGQQPKLKVMLITGHGTEEEARKGIKMGASKYLIKPVNINVLIQEINDVLLNSDNSTDNE